jgi:hypothetical protein
MSALQFLYPVALASANAATGLVLYRVLDTPFGLLLLAMAVAVVVSALYGTVAGTPPARRSGA